ncbi:Excisionase, partial [Yersinia aldovae ATCC 35236]
MQQYRPFELVGRVIVVCLGLSELQPGGLMKSYFFAV